MARRSAKKTKLDDVEGQPDPKTPLDWPLFVSAAQPVFQLLQGDLRARADASSSVNDAMKAQHAAQRDRQRTADSFVVWRDQFITQLAAAWLLSCVFVRTLEDRGLLGHNRIAGPGAADSLKLFLELAPSLNERDYLLTIFRELTRFPSTMGLFDAHQNPVWLLAPSADGAKALVQLFQQPRADVPAFRFGQSDTGFLGWLYQDLDEVVRKRYALWQTAGFAVSFILDRTLNPAIERFGLDDTSIIDPTCGSGHFLLSAFERLFEYRRRVEPGLSDREVARKALDAVYGADINPYAVAIARFRLTLSFMERARFVRLSDAPSLPLHIVVADSLLHNPHVVQPDLADVATSSTSWRGQEFALEDEEAARAVLFRTYSAVVGNPPYDAVKDAALRKAYRVLYPRSAAPNYSIAAPFTERFFQLGRAGGRVGMITANTFMKREFGKCLIEEYLPTINLDLVVNTSEAYIPGFGRPTVLLFGSSEPSIGTNVPVVLASRGEPSKPANPELGFVWRSIADHWSEYGFENEYITVSQIARSALASHPWSLGGGGATDLKAMIEERWPEPLSGTVDDIGLSLIIGEDDVFLRRQGTNYKDPIPTFPIVVGENVRDWSLTTPDEILRPFRVGTPEMEVEAPDSLRRALWPWRAILERRVVSGSTTMKDAGRAWFDVRRLSRTKHATDLSITFAEVATHNHFVLDRGGKVFKGTAPIIKLSQAANEEDHLAILGYLNSSVACFWMKQVFFSVGGSGVGRGIQDEEWESRYQIDSTKLKTAPLPPKARRHVELARSLDENAQRRAGISPSAVLASWLAREGGDLDLASVRYQRDELLAQAVAYQEQLDWVLYEDLGLLSDADIQELNRHPAHEKLPPGQRAFERILRLNEPQSAWFIRNGYADPATAVPDALVTAQITLIQGNKNLALIERPQHKRRWGVPDHPGEERAAARAILAEVVERHMPALSATRLELQRIVSSHLGAKAEALAHLADWPLGDLILAEAVPFVGAARLTTSGLQKQVEWERVWNLQRSEDAGETLNKIARPAEYQKEDFCTERIWQLRGPLDVPKERFISYPGCESDHDGEPVYGWAGWDHEQRAKALATLYWKRKTEESWGKDRLTPMLAGLLELLPWLKHWHSAVSDDYAGDSPANYYAGFLDGECRTLGLTHDDLRAWRPAAKVRGKKATAKTAAAMVSGDDAPAAEPPAKPVRKKRTKKDAVVQEGNETP